MSANERNYTEFRPDVLGFTTSGEAKKVQRLASELYDGGKGSRTIDNILGAYHQKYHRVGSKVCVNGDQEDVENLKNAAKALNKTGTVEDAKRILK